MEAFEAGWRAGLYGCDPRLCPYDKLTREWRDWQRAHSLAVRTFLETREKRPMLRHGEHEFSKEDALRLCREWPDFKWGEGQRHTRDSIENAIEDLCLAMGCTAEEVRATWARNRRAANQK